MSEYAAQRPSDSMPVACCISSDGKLYYICRRVGTVHSLSQEKVWHVLRV